MSPSSRTQKENRKVDCAKLDGEATLALEYKYILDDSSSLLGKVLTGFSCEHSHECGVAQTRGTVTECDWDSCAFHNAFTKQTS